MNSVLTWGSEAELSRAESIARAVPATVVAPGLSLAEIPFLLSGARAVVGVDTGLAHLAVAHEDVDRIEAVALKALTVGIYCATDPTATGLYGGKHAVNLGGPRSSPSVGEVLNALEEKCGL